MNVLLTYGLHFHFRMVAVPCFSVGDRRLSLVDIDLHYKPFMQHHSWSPLDIQFDKLYTIYANLFVWKLSGFYLWALQWKGKWLKSAKWFHHYFRTKNFSSTVYHTRCNLHLLFISSKIGHSSLSNNLRSSCCWPRTLFAVLRFFVTTSWERQPIEIVNLN